MKSTIFFFISFSLLLSGCASIKVYADEELKKEIAFKVYPPVPFLLVEKNVSDKQKVKATIIYLPDYAAPLFIKAKPGIGTANLTFSQEKGYLASFGAVVDSKVPETLAAAAGILPFLSNSEGNDIETLENNDISGFELYKIEFKDGTYNLIKIE